ncbi:glycosyltransferase family 2 protein [bacterium]|nr:glycosyltransferase family 2 protein [candidate division CSSED10-310 bacterium]
MKAITGVVITYNEEHSIRDCLKSLSFVDEIVIIDSNSSDRTRDIAREFTDKVFSVDWKGYAPAKNYGIRKATNDWILSLDADERITDDLRNAILDVVPDRCTAYRISRRTWYLDRWIKGGGWYPDKNIRLFNRQYGQFRNVPVHESVETDGPIGDIEGDILHYSYKDISDHVLRINKYSDLVSNKWLAEDRIVNIGNMVFRPVWEFIRKWLFRGGFRDGQAGVILAGMHAFYTFLKYAKTYERRLAVREAEKE